MTSVCSEVCFLRRLARQAKSRQQRRREMDLAILFDRARFGMQIGTLYWRKIANRTLAQIAEARRDWAAADRYHARAFDLAKLPGASW